MSDSVRNISVGAQNAGRNTLPHGAHVHCHYVSKRCHADSRGVAGANGESFVEDPKLKAALGGQTGIAAVEETLATYGSAQNAPSWLKPMFDTLKAMFGVNAKGIGQLNFEHAIGNEWVSGAAGTSGQHFKYADLANAVYGFVNAKVANGAASVTAPASVTPAAASQATTVRTAPTVMRAAAPEQTPVTSLAATAARQDPISIVAQRSPETAASVPALNLDFVSTAYGAAERRFDGLRSSGSLLSM